jgi:hypothetical protein
LTVWGEIFGALALFAAVFHFIPVFSPGFAPNHWPTTSLARLFGKILLFHTAHPLSFTQIRKDPLLN